MLKHFKNISDNPDNVNMSQIWKKMDKLWPKVGSNLPSAKKNHKRRIVSYHMSLKFSQQKNTRNDCGQGLNLEQRIKRI